MQRWSVYAQDLPSDAKAWYKEKLYFIGGIDLFRVGTLASWMTVYRMYVDASNLVSYLVLQISFITSKQFKARKSLEAYNQFVSGWVKDMCIIENIWLLQERATS